MPHTAIVPRIRAEYLEMPGLRLTLAQAQRLCGIERAVCQRVLDMLVDANFLCRKSDGAYARVTDGRDCSQSPSETVVRRDAQPRTPVTTISAVLGAPMSLGDPPRPSDLVIHLQGHSPAVYVLRTIDGPEQCSFKTFEEALARATSLAIRDHLDTWYTDDMYVFQRVANHRPSVLPTS
jgi:hypothetical protein